VPLEIGIGVSMKRWSLHKDNLSFVDRAQIKQQIDKARKKAEEEFIRKQEGSVLVALNKWRGFALTGQSPYLTHKKVEAFGVRFCGDSPWLFLCRIQRASLWSLQWINQDGTKRFLAGGRKKGMLSIILGHLNMVSQSMSQKAMQQARVSIWRPIKQPSLLSTRATLIQ
jgi:phage/plasmid primase-like uncharacterized protein